MSDIIEVEQEISKRVQVVYSPEMAATRPPTHGERIDALEKALGLHRRLTAREWIRKNWKQLIGPVIALVALIIGNFTWWQPRQVQLRQHAENELSQQIDRQIDNGFTRHHFDEMKTAVDKMNGRMGEISDFLKIVVQNELKRDAALPLGEFQRNLADVGTILAVAKTERIVFPALEESIRTKLSRSDQGQPNYWGAAAALVNYRSSEAVPSELPDCLVGPPVGKIALEHGSTKGTIVDFPTYSNCKIALDDPRARTVLVANSNFGLVLRNCLILWHGGPITILENKKATVTFIDCAFDIVPNDRPDFRGQALLSGLVNTSNQSSATINIQN